MARGIERERINLLRRGEEIIRKENDIINEILK
jgi:hypothetical protein